MSKMSAITNFWNLGKAIGGKAVGWGLGILGVGTAATVADQTLSGGRVSSAIGVSGLGLAQDAQERIAKEFAQSGPATTLEWAYAAWEKFMMFLNSVVAGLGGPKDFGLGSINWARSHQNNKTPMEYNADEDKLVATPAEPGPIGKFARNPLSYTANAVIGTPKVDPEHTTALDGVVEYGALAAGGTAAIWGTKKGIKALKNRGGGNPGGGNPEDETFIKKATGPSQDADGRWRDADGKFTKAPSTTPDADAKTGADADASKTSPKTKTSRTPGMGGKAGIIGGVVLGLTTYFATKSAGASDLEAAKEAGVSVIPYADSAVAATEGDTDYAVRSAVAETGGLAAAWAGAKLGAAGGGAAGSFFAGVGAAPGAVVGGLAGGIAGYFGGSYAVDSLYTYFQADADGPTPEHALRLKESFQRADDGKPSITLDGPVPAPFANSLVYP